MIPVCLTRCRRLEHRIAQYDQYTPIGILSRAITFFDCAALYITDIAYPNRITQKQGSPAKVCIDHDRASLFNVLWCKQQEKPVFASLLSQLPYGLERATPFYQLIQHCGHFFLMARVGLESREVFKIGKQIEHYLRPHIGDLQLTQY